MALSYKDTLRNARLAALTTAVSTAGHILVYTGTAPAKTASPTGTLLATNAVANPLGGAPSAGVLTLGAITTANAAASGTPGYFRLIDGATDDGTHTQLQGDAGVGSGSLTFSSTIVSGAPITYQSATLTEGNA
jgi:hypothetical protein